ncbi:MAG TPA: CHAT domain-containing protein, partial [Sphingomicrobium sp.]|nr:CHAT domain-containing protein [Sphingomicrobium sp.]
MGKAGIALVVSIAVAGWSLPGTSAPLSVRDSFRIGTDGSSLCSAQPLVNDPALTGMFDIGYSITCRDAALPIGKIYQLRTGNRDERLSKLRSRDIACSEPKAGSIEGLGEVRVIDCKLVEADVAYRAYEYSQRGYLFSAEGLTGYDSALRLGLRSIVEDRPVEGEVSIATTGIGDPGAFARIQAGTLDPSRALAEAYRRNNVGSYAEAAEFFASVSRASAGPISRAEASLNEALQKSNLGRYSEADAFFTRAEEQVSGNPIDGRRLRNYRAIHLLNQGMPDDALKELDKPVPKFAARGRIDGDDALAIDAVTAERLNTEKGVGEQLGSSSDELLPEEKAEILDGQALQLRGTSLRLQGDHAAAEVALRAADEKLEA